MTSRRFRTVFATAADAEQLADMRAQAMRPSLEAVGRFDPDRVRNRFLGAFQPSETRIVHVGNKVAGFFVVRHRADHLYLDHLYLAAAFQGQGLGREIVEALQADATRLSLPIRLMALNGSPANEFYLSCGFAFVSADALDTIYEWVPT